MNVPYLPAVVRVDNRELPDVAIVVRPVAGIDSRIHLSEFTRLASYRTTALLFLAAKPHEY